MEAKTNLNLTQTKQETPAYENERVLVIRFMFTDSGIYMNLKSAYFYKPIDDQWYNPMASVKFSEVNLTNIKNDGITLNVKVECGSSTNVVLNNDVGSISLNTNIITNASSDYSDAEITIVSGGSYNTYGFLVQQDSVGNDISSSDRFILN